MGRFAVWFVQIFCFPLFVDSSTIFGKDYCFLNKGYHKNEAFLNAVSSKIQNETFITNAEYASLINYFDDDKIGDIYEVLDDKYCKETYAKQPYSHPTKHFHAYFLICDLMKKSKGSKQQRKYGKEFVKQYVTILTLISCFDNVKFEFESSGTVTDYMLQQQIRNLISFLFINFEHNLPKFCKLYDSFAIELTEKCGLDGSETLILPAGYACDNTTNPKFKWHFLAANFQYYFKNTEINHFSTIIGMKEDYKYRRTQITSMNIIETCMKYSDDDAYSGGLNFLPKLMTSILLTQMENFVSTVKSTCIALDS
uniref:Uncharacterized protein n=1 Tax=Rhabditophanes sp. KR3021 TaxID=114890 RepID=A0AC35U3W3_9BILA